MLEDMREEVAYRFGSSGVHRGAEGEEVGKTKGLEGALGFEGPLFLGERARVLCTDLFGRDALWV